VARLDADENGGSMRNIPTDLLRALVTIIDMKGFTRAGERLGRSQPAISFQIKRLEDLLGVALFDRDGGGTQPTEAGELVAGYARRILSLNDELVLRLSRRDSGGRLRLGIPNDYADYFLPKLMNELRIDNVAFSFDVVCDLSHELLDGLRAGRFDVVVAMTPDGPAEGAFMTWREPISWFGASDVDFGKEVAEDAAPLRIVCYPEGCLYRRTMLSALQTIGRGYEIVYSSPSISGIEAAVKTGFGVTVLADRLAGQDVHRLDERAGFPDLPDVVVGVYLGRTIGSAAAESIAARLSTMFANGSARRVAANEPLAPQTGGKHAASVSR
jgi:DNA-binding transcriptional LysR family regulator